MSQNADWSSRFESALDRQIRAAEERGEFDDLPGKGKPLVSESAPYRAEWWVNQVIERERAGAYAIPPALALRKIADELQAGAVGFESERVVRAAVEDYNERADVARKLPQEGRAVMLPRLEADAIVEGWRAARS
jgi:DnaJ homologue, subfamily C, member 28, conserved domain